MKVKLISLLSVTLLLSSCSFGEKPNESLLSFKKVCAKWSGLDIAKLKQDTIENLIIESTPFINEGIAYGDGVSPIGERWQASFGRLQQIMIDQNTLLDEVFRYRSKGDELADMLAKKTFEIRQDTIDIQLRTSKKELASYCEYVAQQLKREGLS